MSELNSTFRVEKPVFEWPKNSEKTPAKPQIRVKTMKSTTPCLAQRVPVHSEKTMSVAPLKIPCGPRRVPVTQASATPHRDPDFVRRSVYATPNPGHENRNAAVVTSAGPRRIPVTQGSVTPCQNPQTRQSIYFTPSTVNGNTTCVSVTSARKNLPQPQRVPMSEVRPEKSTRKSRNDKVQKFLNFEA